jgi:hypothetical protein
VVDIGIGSGIEERLVAVCAPTNQERWGPFGAVDLEDLTVSVGLVELVALDDDTVSDFGMHGDLLSALHTPESRSPTRPSMMCG